MNLLNVNSSVGSMYRGFIMPEHAGDERLIEQFASVGIGLDQITDDQLFPEFLEALQPGYKVIVPSFAAVFGSMTEMMVCMVRLVERGIELVSLDEPWLVITQSNIDLVRSLISFDSQLRAVQTKRGLERAKAEGKVLGRPVGSTTVADNVKMAQMLRSTMKISVNKACKMAGCHPRTYYRYIDSSKKVEN